MGLPTGGRKVQDHLSRVEEVRLNFSEIRKGEGVRDVNYRGKYLPGEECAVP